MVSGGARERHVLGHGEESEAESLRCARLTFTVTIRECSQSFVESFVGTVCLEGET